MTEEEIIYALRKQSEEEIKLKCLAFDRTFTSYKFIDENTKKKFIEEDAEELLNKLKEFIKSKLGDNKHDFKV